ncbi:hypothetical protein NEF87_001405 [Candidatus Lokiarchaeum ossiferum]|uniref:Fe-S hydro-lyase tartrate dehydratase alpha-type catalytic domain-containing protein n=1 Tax=Candidatus Lokiarchaeum ossiferum TaxID=2951803 RepID=A0ABY6HNM3_9ARCH|nr:hypothetical protein NEF87_001405 [Candidatus Lokiarchaeum sp. B-35]
MHTSALLASVELAIYDLILKSSTSVCEDTIQKLKEIREIEKENPIQLSQIDLMLDNIEYGHSNQIPLCQDTGHINLFFQIGSNFPLVSNFKEISLRVLKKLTAESLIRPNSVDPITQINEGFNGGENMPPIYLDIIPKSSDLVITAMNKGGGSENMSKLFMLPAATGIHDFIPKIVEQMKFAGGKPCPPTILGIGLGGDASKCMSLAKKALLRPLGVHHIRKDVAALELSLLQQINDLDIGIMGLGGHSNCLDVRIEIGMRHPATFPVGLIVECYCHRTESCRITSLGKITFGKLNSQFKFEEDQ